MSPIYFSFIMLILYTRVRECEQQYTFSQISVRTFCKTHQVKSQDTVSFLNLTQFTREEK